ncbi:MAG: peptidase M14 [Gemmatimonadetes bacterium]|nr:peptidase M14 [Gemmatimonadota bacterium]
MTTAAVLAGACASAGPAGPGATRAGGTPTATLEALHETVRVEGLEDRRFQPEHYWRVVEPVVRRGGHLSMERVGQSAEGRPLREITYGEGPTTVLLWSQMHGDESTASMTLADVFAFLADRPDHPLARLFRERLTLHFVPLLNPDGAARFQRRNAQGVDVNRDARMLATPEGRTLKAVRDRVEPDFGFNLHDQNVRTRVGDSGRGAAIALLAPAFNEARDVNALRERAMRVASVIVEAIDPLVGEHIARYDDTFNPRAFGDLMAAWGASTILIESGGWRDDPQKQYLRKTNFVAILAALEAIARESWTAVPTTAYETLPRNGRSVGDLLVTGGTLAVPSLPPLLADVMVQYERPLLEEGGLIDEIGDLGGFQARDTVRVDGLYLVPLPEALDAGPPGTQIRLGAPARFVVARRPDGGEPVWTFDGGPVPATARRPR